MNNQLMTKTVAREYTNIFVLALGALKYARNVKGETQVMHDERINGWKTMFRKYVVNDRVDVQAMVGGADWDTIKSAAHSAEAGAINPDPSTMMTWLMEG